MTEKPRPDNRLVQIPPDPASITSFVETSIRPGSSVMLAFSEATMNIFLDRTGDWTITLGLSTKNSRMSSLAGQLEELGFFRATEDEGTVYFLWTSALLGLLDTKHYAEEKLLAALTILQRNTPLCYIS
ncbi:hypothetical protein AUG19_07715 [archaeon 13_1_20CM_2_54_9]|nr:MAG: hypothetical protein AUJ07_10050 [Crenarchaeota archaeon 13_1_40CM_3_53_5]OLE74806.1 MAG: hypothetical protein AUG19_07715 [archaeon 13_1_20CM_2_54_9]